ARGPPRPRPCFRRAAGGGTTAPVHGGYRLGGGRLRRRAAPLLRRGRAPVVPCRPRVPPRTEADAARPGGCRAPPAERGQGAMVPAASAMTTPAAAAASSVSTTPRRSASSRTRAAARTAYCQG